MELELVAPMDFLERLSTGRFEAALFEFVARTPSWVYGFWRSPPRQSQVWVRHGYAAADQELDALKLAEDETQVREAIAAIYKKMAEDPPAVFIAWPEIARAVSARYDVPIEKNRDVFGANLWLWRPARQP
jgi:hypothetical protein